MSKHKFLIGTGLFLIAWVADANTTVFKPVFPDLKNSKRATLHQIEKLPQATLSNQVSIDTYIAAIPNPFEDTGFYKDYSACNIDNFHQVQCQFNYKLATQHAKQFKVLLLPGVGAVLAPTTWQVIRTDMGPSGIASAVIASPKKDEAMTIYNSSACVGCAMRAATLYFPETMKESLANEFGATTDPEKHLTLIRVNAQKVFYSYQIPKRLNKTHGVALYWHSKQQDDNFQNIEISVNPEHQHLVRDMLNFYIATHE